MAKTLSGRIVHDAAEQAASARTSARGPGRPPNPDAVRHHARVGLPTLQAWAAALATCLEQPRAKSTAQTLADLRTDILRRANGLAGAGGKAPTVGYRVVTADGEEHTVDTVGAAAALYGCAPTSLPVLLSRGDGKAQKRAWHLGSASVVTVERLTHP